LTTSKPQGDAIVGGSPGELAEAGDAVRPARGGGRLGVLTERRVDDPAQVGRTDATRDAERSFQMLLTTARDHVVSARDVRVEREPERTRGVEPVILQELPGHRDVDGVGIEDRHLDEIEARLGGGPDGVSGRGFGPVTDPDECVYAEGVHERSSGSSPSRSSSFPAYVRATRGRHAHDQTGRGGENAKNRAGLATNT
jgi:hypothetical protein